MKDCGALSSAEVPGRSKGVGSEAETGPAPDGAVDRVVEELKQNGVVVLPPLLSETQIGEMRRAFEARLSGVRWNDLDGYEREPLRHVLEDVLTL